MIGQNIRLVTIILFSTFTLSCAVKTSPLKEMPLTEIQSIDITEGAEKTTVVVEGQEPMIYTTFRLPNPDRLVIDMPGIGLGSFNNKIVIEKGPIRSILPKIGERNRVSRLEFELIGSVETDVRTEGLKLVVEAVGPPEEGAEESSFVFFQAEEPVRLPDEEVPDEKAVDEGLKEILSSLVREEAPMRPAENVNDIHFDKEDGLQLVITSDGRLDPKIFLLGEDRLVIDLPDVKATIKERRIPVDDPSVKRLRIGQHPDRLRLVLDLLSPVDYSWKQRENQMIITLQTPPVPPLEVETPAPVAPPPSLVEGPAVPVPLEVEVPAPVVPPPSLAESLAASVAKEEIAPPPEALFQAPTKKEGRVEEEARDVAVEEAVVEEAAVEEVERPSSEPMTNKPVVSRPAILEIGKPTVQKEKKEKVEEKQDVEETAIQKKFVGRKISLDFQDANIANVIRLIADVSGMNIVMGDDVKGKVTLRLINVPWDQALDIVLKMNNLGQIREGNILRISTLANITRQQDEEARAKETKVRAEDLVTRVIRINYGKAKTLLDPLTKLLSPRGDMTTDARTNAIIVKDIEKNVNEIGDMVKALDTKTPQVMIEARIVQIRPEFKRELGVQWGADFKTTSSGNLIGVGNAASGSLFNAPTPDFVVNAPAALNLGGVGFTFGRLTSNPFTLDLRLSAGESQGMTRIISTPKITVLDNQEAKIEQGESIPFATTSQQGTQTTFIDANLSLRVTPHISPDGGVVMDIKISKNAPGKTLEGADGPSILKKEATTHILVMDGETAVIGGVFETVETETIEGIPYLMDIPFLGWLFKREIKDENTSELLVFLTPTISK